MGLETVDNIFWETQWSSKRSNRANVISILKLTEQQHELQRAFLPLWIHVLYSFGGREWPVCCNFGRWCWAQFQKQITAFERHCLRSLSGKLFANVRCTVLLQGQARFTGCRSNTCGELPVLFKVDMRKSWENWPISLLFCNHEKCFICYSYPCPPSADWFQ